MSYTPTALYAPNPATARGQATKLDAVKSKIAYASGRTIVLRDLADPALSTAYTAHVQPTTAARISPSGFYVASADSGGTVRVWDAVGDEHVQKGEWKVISGRINDLAWDGESKRVIAVGDGREKFGHAFMVDTGSSTGEISGHNKQINAVSIRHQRPFRAASAGDDGLVVFYTGAPYKYERTLKQHTKFVQDVRFSPSGAHFASAGSDGAVWLYDGASGEVVGQFGEGAGHSGSVMACAWSPDSKTLATAGADCTVRLWDVETRAQTALSTLGSGVSHQQVGATWSTHGGAEGSVVSLSMSGDLNVFDGRKGGAPVRVISGPQKAITAITSSSSKTFLAGTADGRVLSYDVASKASTHLDGEGHSNLVSGLAASAGSSDATAWSVGYDDRVREISLGSGAFTPASAKTTAQPRALAALPDGTLFVAESTGVEVLRANQLLLSLPMGFAPASVVAAAASSGAAVVAVGGEDQKVHLYDWAENTLRGAGTLEGSKGAVSALAFSPDGTLLAAGDSTGKIILFDVKERKAITSRWSFHTARINALAFTPDGAHVASASLDTHVYIWSVSRPMKNVAIKGAGPGGVNAVWWLGVGAGKGQLVSGGADGVGRGWEVVFHPAA